MSRVDLNWRTSTYADASVEGFILQIASDGISGIGSTAAHPSNMPADDLEAMLRGPVREILIGSDPLDGNAIRQRLRAAQLPPRAVIAADLALNDYLGKRAHLPCSVLWGGAIRTEVPVVRMVGLKAPEDLEKAVGALRDEGYAHFKVKVGTGIEHDTERIRTLRTAFGETIWIAIDGNGAYDAEGAIALSHELEQFDVSLIEQPVPYADREGMVRVTASSAIPIMADQIVTDVATALIACQRQMAHVVSVKISKMGTIDEARRVTDLCEAYGVGVHVGGSVAPAAVDAAQMQLAASMPWISAECEVGEHLAVTGDPLSGLVVEDGCARIGNEPGLGIGLARGTA